MVKTYVSIRVKPSEHWEQIQSGVSIWSGAVHWWMYFSITTLNGIGKIMHFRIVQ